MKDSQERGTTVYLVNRRIEMLPSLLTCDLCSLRSDVDRLAFSVVWELDKVLIYCSKRLLGDHFQ